ncbi:MAG TPA: ester cyclase [Phenylobacterium sp.]|uniref:nuclear transport factor 2 family protein n=1 Tax=Phenylobacterium sp. TaxID=1871053 RepID=UPI002B46C474|nr:ester cyclase [Phenylobacterium sp.]HKR86598.1 ester cyclase [Phenylobacterium sp.]HKT52908.1 ester cyclase [Caulobacteraceae bacterium]
MSLKAIAESWARLWSQTNSAAFASIFDEAIVYRDNAFDIRRAGRAEVEEHHRIWLAAAPDFSIEIERLHESGDTVILEGLGRGAFSGEDLGGGALKATGKAFEGRLAAVIVCGDRGIVRCTEYYDRLQMPGLPLA